MRASADREGTQNSLPILIDLSVALRAPWANILTALYGMQDDDDAFAQHLNTVWWCFVVRPLCQQ